MHETIVMDGSGQSGQTDELWYSNLGHIFEANTNDKDCYNGNMEDNVERKFTLGLERCDQNTLDNDAKKKGFSKMLCRIARQFYFDKRWDKDLSLEELADAVEKRINTEDWTRALLWEWESATLKSFIMENAEKPERNPLTSLSTSSKIFKCRSPSSTEPTSFFATGYWTKL